MKVRSVTNHINLVVTGCLIILCACTSTTKETEPVYQEPHRLQFHFSQPSHWMNDPNGMVYYAGEYHLFYQHYPDSTVWGPMHWGHAVSTDMVHWEHLPIALFPDSLGYIYSGSCVVDANNTSGLQSGTEKPLVAIFTYDKKGYETQAIAVSSDKGRTFSKYSENPVIKNPDEKNFRDPKVFWHNESEHWIMSLAVDNRIQFYRSKNFKEWELTGEFGREHGGHGGVWECPDLFPLIVSGSEETKWVLLVSINPGGPNGGSATQYFTGQFDGKTFTSENDSASVRWIDYGPDNYAGVTWSNAPDNRTLFLGWMGNWNYANVVPTEKWRSAMTIPRELSLVNTEEGTLLVSTPVKELEKLRGIKKVFDASGIQNHSGLLEVVLEFDVSESSATDFGVELYNSKNESVTIGYNKLSNQYFIDRTHSGKVNFSDDFAGVHIASRVSTDQTIRFHLFIDRASVELFGDNGKTCMTEIFFPNEDFKNIRLYEKDGKAKLLSGEAYELKAIW